MDQERNKRVKVMQDLKLVLQSLKSRSQQYHPGDKSLQRKKKKQNRDQKCKMLMESGLFLETQ